MESYFGCAAKASQGRAKVVCNIVERFAHGTDERLIFVEKRIEKEDKFIQFVFGLAGGNASVELAGTDDRAGRRDNLADRLHGAMGEQCTRKKSKDERCGAGEVKIVADRV